MWTQKQKQNWTVGSTVNVGFLRGLRVLARIPTPGNGAPDEYALVNAAGDRYYRFTPHLGLRGVASRESALSSVPTV